jgi:hypothetical protein
MLGTRYKSKLPRGWSYPVGAQTLSDALEGVAGASERPLFFWDYQIRTSRHRRERAEGKPYPVLEVSYSKPFFGADAEYLASQGATDQWTITVNPVPSDRAALVRHCVVSAGLSRVREWLDRTRALEARQGRGFCRLLHDELGGRILLQCRLNDFDDPEEVELACPDPGGAG